MQWIGVLFGIFVFISIGIYHVLVVKLEYHLGTWPWVIFCILGIISIVLAVICHNPTSSMWWGYLAFLNLWTIKEMFEQKARVEKGWYPRKSKKEEFIN